MNVYTYRYCLARMKAKTAENFFVTLRTPEQNLPEARRQYEEMIACLAQLKRTRIVGTPFAKKIIFHGDRQNFMKWSEQ